ncbi:hypothetical protein N0V90_003368 [Kalmusia sp. IMI 367209]|nr:hypothetical protein N0V90_003368 [Kalmusia sp. IMI 367209]
MSKFALLCQAARLLGQVLLYVASSDLENNDDVGMQLDRTLHSILVAALDVEVPDYDQITFIFSALVALYTPTYRLAGSTTSNANPVSTIARTARALAVCELVTERMHLNSGEAICPLTSRPSEQMSPWGCFFAYQVCAVHLRVRERNEESDQVIGHFRVAFRAIERGGVAGKILEGKGEESADEWHRCLSEAA